MRHRRAAFYVFALALACAGQDSGEARAGESGRDASITCRVSRVADGDSLVCSGDERVRLLMIDAPELAQGEAGARSRDALRSLAPVGTVLDLETDVRSRDDYDRILAYAWLSDGRMLNEEMARSGYVTALVYPPNVKHADLIRKAVDEAREAKRGLWATDFFDCLPREYRAGRCT